MNSFEDAKILQQRRLVLKALSLTPFVFVPKFANAASGEQDRTYGGFPMGLHGATVRNFPNDEALRILTEELGLHRIELTPSQIRLRAFDQGNAEGPIASTAEVRQLKQQLAAAGVTATAYGFLPMAGDAGENERVFELASELSIRNITVVPQLQYLDSIERLADEYDIRLAIHNNAPGSTFTSIAEVSAAISGRGENVGACVDVGNVLRSSEDPAVAIRRLGSKVFGIHLKDVSSADPDSDVIGLGKGLLDTETFFTAMIETELAADMALSLEYLALPDQPVPSVLQSLALADRLLS
jgi:sugar phosphate isomerase/epimerase